MSEPIFIPDLKSSFLVIVLSLISISEREDDIDIATSITAPMLPNIIPAEISSLRLILFKNDSIEAISGVENPESLIKLAKLYESIPAERTPIKEPEIAANPLDEKPLIRIIVILHERNATTVDNNIGGYPFMTKGTRILVIKIPVITRAKIALIPRPLAIRNVRIIKIDESPINQPVLS